MRTTLAVLFIFLSVSLFSDITPELNQINDLIAHTKESVLLQEKIRAELIEYQKINKAFLQNPDDKELLFCTIKAADSLFHKIKEAHLTENFSSEFIKELTLFSQFAKKKEFNKP